MPVTPLPTASPEARPTSSPTNTPEPTKTPTASATPKPSPTATSLPTNTPVQMITVTPTATVTLMPVAASSPSPTNTPTPSPTVTASPTPKPTSTPSPTVTASPTPTVAEVVARIRDSVVQIKTDQGTGSGFIVDADGIIATAYHVVEDARNIEIVFADLTSATATILGQSLGSDLALVSVERTHLSPAILASSGVVSVGDTVLKLGYGSGSDKEATLSSGVVSALSRLERFARL